MSNKREVKLVAMAAKYKKHPLVLIGIPYGNTYITGQEYLPGVAETEGGLTANQMLGLEPLTKEQKLKYPYIIKPDEFCHFPNGITFDIDNPEQKAKLEFMLKVGRDTIAKSKAEYVRGKHTHYIFDKVMEAKSVVDENEKFFAAMSYVKNASTEFVIDIAYYMGYAGPKDYLLNPANATKDEIYASLYKVCKSSPDLIINCFSRDIKDEMLIVKMIKVGVIEKKADGYFDSGQFLGASMNSVVEFMNKKQNAGRTSKWQSMSTSLKQETPKDENTREEFLRAMEKAISAEDFDAAIATNNVLDGKQLSEEQRARFMNLKSELAEKQRARLEEYEKLDIEKQERINEAFKLAKEEYSDMELEDLKKVCGNKKKKKEEWEALEKPEIIEYLLKFVKA